MENNLSRHAYAFSGNMHSIFMHSIAQKLAKMCSEVEGPIETVCEPSDV